MLTNQTMPTAPIRKIIGKVELFNSSTLIDTFNYNDILRSIEINRTCEESKLIGTTIGQKAQVTLINKDKRVNAAEENEVKIYFDNEQGYITNFPNFKISEVKNNDTQKEIILVAYDLMQEAAKHTVDELELVDNYTILNFITACATLLGAQGIKLEGLEENDSLLNLNFPEGANFTGEENLRQALNAIAEVTATIIFFNHENKLTLKRLNTNIATDFSKRDYFNLTTTNSIQFTNVAHVTELGDNVKVNEDDSSIFYIRNNPFLDNRTDLGAVLSTILTYIKDLVFTAFELSARGNYLIELGDLILMEGKEEAIKSYFLNDSIKYTGGLTQQISLKYDSNINETVTSTSNLGDLLNTTIAKVDKVNREIELLASEEDLNASKLAALELTTNSIASRVEASEAVADDINNQLNTLTNRVNATVTAEDVKIEIQKELSDNTTSSVTTSTGFTFNEAGLSVSRDGSEISTTITDDGMKVYKNNQEVLVADNEGVKAIDLHATTYLIVGANSRFEDYSKSGQSRTGCFWIGG